MTCAGPCSATLERGPCLATQGANKPNKRLFARPLSGRDHGIGHGPHDSGAGQRALAVLRGLASHRRGVESVAEPARGPGALRRRSVHSPRTMRAPRNLPHARQQAFLPAACCRQPVHASCPTTRSLLPGSRPWEPLCPRAFAHGSLCSVAVLCRQCRLVPPEAHDCASHPVTRPSHDCASHQQDPKPRTMPCLCA